MSAILGILLSSCIVCMYQCLTILTWETANDKKLCIVYTQRKNPTVERQSCGCHDTTGLMLQPGMNAISRMT